MICNGTFSRRMAEVRLEEKVIFWIPALPFFVVIKITPLAACEVNRQMISDYIRYLGNLRWTSLGYPALYPGFESEPESMEWVSQYADANMVKTPVTSVSLPSINKVAFLGARFKSALSAFVVLPFE